MSKPKVIVVGGGFSGCAAAVAAAKAGASVQLLERTDMLGGAGLRAGRMNYNGKFVAAEECKAMGAGEIFEALENIVLHRANIVDEENVYIYNVGKLDMTLQRVLQKWGVQYRLVSRIVGVKKKDNRIEAVTLNNKEKIEGDVFLDCTGSFGGIDNCVRFGKGCVMCIHRCPIFGNRVSIATKAGAQEIPHLRPDGTPGRLSPSITVFKESLSPELQRRVEKEGAFSIKLPREMIDYNKETSLFPGIRGEHQIEHINLVNIGLVVKCPAIGYFHLEDWRKIPGFENVLVEHPMGGAIFNFV
ncbi:MAG: FAD-dependent oxidoreductase, partial [Dehalococcoidia bacterium]|nr:FAD-dependent oxidoreductase [Dehalococcoidia bacterium]